MLGLRAACRALSAAVDDLSSTVPTQTGGRTSLAADTSDPACIPAMVMHPRAIDLIAALELEPHPEGGFFTQAFRSPLAVSPSDGRGSRSSLTVIYFLLVEGTFSRWHRVLSDEAWHFYEGSPVELLTLAPSGGDLNRVTLGPLSAGSAPLHVVPARWWQAARPLGAYSLVGCSVGPGFDYADFTLLSSVPRAEWPSITPPSLLAELL